MHIFASFLRLCISPNECTIARLAGTTKEVHSRQVLQKTQTTLSQWVTSKPSKKKDDPNWQGANTSHPVPSTTVPGMINSKTCLPYAWNQRSKLIHSPLHVRKKTAHSARLEWHASLLKRPFWSAGFTKRIMHLEIVNPSLTNMIWKCFVEVLCLKKKIQCSKNCIA